MRPCPPQADDVPPTDSIAEVDATQRAFHVPRVLAFYEDVWDNDGNVIAWRTIAWGLAIADGFVVTIPVGQPTSATLWLGLEDAAAALDAHVDAIDPRRPMAELPPSHASTTPPPRSSDGAAALAAYPDDPDAGEGRDRPLGGLDAVAGVAWPPMEGRGS
jgi:hypothetical protein